MADLDRFAVVRMFGGYGIAVGAWIGAEHQPKNVGTGRRWLIDLAGENSA